MEAGHELAGRYRTPADARTEAPCPVGYSSRHDAKVAPPPQGTQQASPCRPAATAVPPLADADSYSARSSWSRTAPPEGAQRSPQQSARLVAVSTEDDESRQVAADGWRLGSVHGTAGTCDISPCPGARAGFVAGASAGAGGHGDGQPGTVRVAAPGSGSHYHAVRVGDGECAGVWRWSEHLGDRHRYRDIARRGWHVGCDRRQEVTRLIGRE